jgi:uncharacterized protein
MSEGALTKVAEEARIMGAGMLEGLAGLFEPTVRLGVTGLSRAGKTVFTTALVRALTGGAPLSLLTAQREGRIRSARLAPQPDQDVPRFPVEEHVETLLAEVGDWPASTTRLSELRLIIDYAPSGWRGKLTGNSRLTLDIVDYPGEWLLDLSLIGKSYEAWSAETIALAREAPRRALAASWLAETSDLAAGGPADETTARRTAHAFTSYLRECRTGKHALSTLPPGRFLLPGEMEGSPALTFAPLVVEGLDPSPGTLHGLMAERYDAYISKVVRPFFRDHFARLDRQIVLVDALGAIDAGPHAVQDLERALDGVLAAFRTGARDPWTGWFRPKIDRVLFAATKADHLAEVDHPRLAAILRRLVERASTRASNSGADVKTIALAAIRATREAVIEEDGERLPAIAGRPLKGQSLGDEVFDGVSEVALFPGDLPADPGAIHREGFASSEDPARAVRYLRFRPPGLGPDGHFPHIGLDAAAEFLIGDRLT